MIQKTRRMSMSMENDDDNDTKVEPFVTLFLLILIWELIPSASSSAASFASLAFSSFRLVAASVLGMYVCCCC